MRLVTYDRGGQRRLGAILEGEVVDLPDAVGHPAFPITLEGLVSTQPRHRHGHGARRAGARRRHGPPREAPRDPHPAVPDLAARHPTPRRSSGGSSGPRRRCRGPKARRGSSTSRRWPRSSGSRPSATMPEDMGNHVFGYTLVSDWRARDESGAPVSDRRRRPDRDRPVRRDGRRPRPADDVPAAPRRRRRGGQRQPQRRRGLAPGDDQRHLAGGAARTRRRVGARALPRPGAQLWPGATVELAAEGVGTLRNRIAD